MILRAREIKNMRQYFENPYRGIKPLYLASKAKTAPLSGKALAVRLKGLLTKKAASQLDRHINESCEQVDD